MFNRRHAARGASIPLLAAMLAVALTSLLAFAPIAGAQPAQQTAPADSANRHGVNLASPAVVRIVSEVDGQVVCKACYTDGTDITLPLDGGTYGLAFTGSGAFISSDGYVLTADHVVDYSNNDQIIVDFFNSAVDEFAQDVRMSSDLTWNGNTSVTLTVPDNYASSGNKVTYGYDNSTTGPTANSFYRLPGTASSTSGRFVLARNVTSLTFLRYTRTNTVATDDFSAKRLQLTMNLRTTAQTTVDQNTLVISASYVLRNKPSN